jgi:hypothetical protein
MGSVQCPTLRTLLVALNSHEANTPAQDRSQFGVAGAVIVDRRVDHLHRLAFEAIGDLLERPALLILDRALDELLGEAIDLLALSLSFGSMRFSSRRSASVNIFSRDLPPGFPEMPFLNAIAIARNCAARNPGKGIMTACRPGKPTPGKDIA